MVDDKQAYVGLANFRTLFGDELWSDHFWNALRKNFKTGLREIWNSVYKRGYLKQVHKYCPSITASDLLPYRTGVRAMAVLKDGNMIQDFLFEETRRSLHVCSAPSPAATSAIPIGRHICDRILNYQ